MINIKTDSRKVKKGDIFAAIKCEVNDGHKYIDAAIKNGASKELILKSLDIYEEDYNKLVSEIQKETKSK